MALTGYKRPCGKNNGGVVILALIEAAMVKSVTLDSTSNTATAITLEPAVNKFKTYQFNEDDCEFKESSTFENGAYKVDVSVQFKLPTMDQASRTAVEEIAEASYCGLIGLIKLPNSEARLIGYSDTYKKERPLRLRTSEGTSGKLFGDPHGEDVVVGCIQPSKSVILTAEIDTLIDAGA